MNVLYLHQSNFKPLSDNCDVNDVFCGNNLYKSTDDIFLNLFVILFFLGTAFGMSFILVSYVVESTGEIENDNPEEESSSDDEEKEEPYEYKYSDLFEELNETQRDPLTVEAKKALKKEVITETTPKGNVVMYYNYNEQEPGSSAFHYYCDDRSIQFNYLDTVARKYVTTHNCTELYLYLKTEIKREVEKIKNDVEREKEQAEKMKQDNESEKKENSVFATFKNYKKQETPKKTARRILVGKNRYTRLGNIEDWNISQIPKQETTVKPISFSEYKKKLQSS